MLTIILNPILASQAPRVNMINAIDEMLIILVTYKNEGINRTSDSIIPSKHKRAINKCVRCMMKANSVIK